MGKYLGEERYMDRQPFEDIHAKTNILGPLKLDKHFEDI